MSTDLRSRAIQILLDRLAAGRYPSVSMLDRIEGAMAERETASRYVNLLLDTIQRDTYPSPTMLDRVLALVDELEPRP